MVVVPLTNGMLSDGLMVRLMEVRSRTKAGAVVGDDDGELLQYGAEFTYVPFESSTLISIPVCIICISLTSIPP